MQRALQLAALGAGRTSPNPLVGCVVLDATGNLVGEGFHQRAGTAHAEVLALTTAFNYLGSKYLPEATLYVTVEPCLMCCGALYWSKIGRIVFVSDQLDVIFSRRFFFCFVMNCVLPPI